ncbi:DUF2953 domain-containing protein [Virgibacillus sp. AGTR]|nr:MULTISPECIES: DUF2953 domain-containing protein [Virgibacillus]MCC2250210.1 DUF2953 domain-containing protein [Virgibacillus sp. AGTR]WBX78908.1 DUF2953 domain-containing protein [Virgibacillus salarius]
MIKIGNLRKNRNSYETEVMKMWGWAIFMITVIAIAVIFLFSKLIIHVQGAYCQANTSITIRIYWWKIPIIRRTMMLDDFESNTPAINFRELPSKLNEALHILRQGHKAISVMLQKMKFKQMKWHTVGGTGDASLTGIVSGGVWTVKGVIIAWLQEHGIFNCHPDIKVVPLFQQKYIQSEIYCIVSIRIAQAISGFLQVMRIMANNKKLLIHQAQMYKRS